jgi:hypothetical protein
MVQGLERRPAVFVNRDDLAIQNGRFGTQIPTMSAVRLSAAISSACSSSLKLTAAATPTALRAAGGRGLQRR